MSKPKEPSAPTIELLPLAKFEIDTTLSGRSDKEIKDNARALKPQMEAFRSWDATQPGQYFERDGKKHLCAGFTRHAAATDIGIKHGYFVKIEDNPAALRTACIRTNLGKPISAFEQGRIYAKMRDGDDVATLPVGAEAMMPMEISDIAKEVGFSRQHIDNCIATFEETPEIADLIIDGLISSRVATRARQLVKADGKRLQFLKAAIKAAKDEGKDTATMQHLKQVQPEFVPLKAAESGKPAESAASESPTKKGKKDSGDSSDSKSEGSDEPKELDLGGTSNYATPTPAKITNQTLAQKFRGVIEFVNNERGMELDEADVEALTDALIALPF